MCKMSLLILYKYKVDIGHVIGFGPNNMYVNNMISCCHIALHSLSSLM